MGTGGTANSNYNGDYNGAAGGGRRAANYNGKGARNGAAPRRLTRPSRRLPPAAPLLL